MKEFLYYITEEDGRSLLINNGVVNTSSQPVPLPNTPEGWQNLIINWERELAKYGITRSTSTPLAFLLDAAKILRFTNYTQSYERKLFLLIQQLATEVDAVYYKQKYRYFYKGELDLSTMKDDDIKFTCTLMEGGLSKLLKANENTVYPIEFDSTAVNVEMSGISIYQKATYDITPIMDRSDGFSGNLWKDLKTIGFSFISKEGVGSGIALFSQNIEQVDESNTKEEYMASSTNYFAINNSSSTINLRIQGKLKFYCKTKTGTVHYYADFNKQDGTSYAIFNNLTLVEGVTFEQDFDHTIPLGPGEKLFLLSFFDNSGGGTNLAEVEYQETDPVTIEYNSTKETTFCKAYKPYDLFRKLIERITGSANNASSELLQEHSNLVITCGDAIRGIEGAKIKTSLNQLFDHVNAVHCAGIGIENGKVVIEERAHFFDTSNPIDLGTVKNAEKAFATELMGNTLEIGWPEPNVEDVNGKYSFNGFHSYSTTVTRIVKKIEIKSPFGADPYEIELIRINLDGKTTTDSSSDNKNYVLNVDNASETVLATVSFSEEGGFMVAPFSIGFVKDQLIRITGSASNDGEYTVTGVAQLLGIAQLVGLDGSLTDEEDVPVLIEFLNGAVFPLKRIAYDTLEGVPTNTVFNIEELTPKRLLKKHGPWLRSVFWPFDDQKFTFETTQRNEDLKTVKGSETIQENANVNISSLGPRLFLPLYYDFETTVPSNLVELLEEAPNRCFQWTDNGNTYKGFLIKASLAANTLQEQKLRMLCAPDVNLENLVV